MVDFPLVAVNDEHTQQYCSEGYDNVPKLCDLKVF